MSKKVLNKKELFVAESMADELSSIAIPILFEDNIGFQLAWTGTANGTIKVQCTIDDPYAVTPPVWNDLSFTPTLAQPSGTDGGYLINVNQCPFPYIRLSYSPGAGPTTASLVEQDITYTAVTAGNSGNNITIQYINDGIAGAETVNVVVNAITVHMDDTAITGSTANDIQTAIQASAPALLLVNSAMTGTGSNVQAASGPDNLSSGFNEDGIFTASVCGKQV